MLMGTRFESQSTLRACDAHPAINAVVMIAATLGCFSRCFMDHAG